MSQQPSLFQDVEGVGLIPSDVAAADPHAEMNAAMARSAEMRARTVPSTAAVREAEIIELRRVRPVTGAAVVALVSDRSL